MEDIGNIKSTWQASAEQAGDKIQSAIQTATGDTGVPPWPTESALRLLTEASGHLTTAINEAMAQAALEGSSLRKLAGIAGVAPNSVAPKLARSSSLGRYAEPDGTLSAEGIAAARYEARTTEGNKPFVFTPRKKD